MEDAKLLFMHKNIMLRICLEMKKKKQMIYVLFVLDKFINFSEYIWIYSEATYKRKTVTRKILECDMESC